MKANGIGKRIATAALAILLCLPSPAAFAEQDMATGPKAEASGATAAAESAGSGAEDAGANKTGADGPSGSQTVIEDDEVPLSSSGAAFAKTSSASASAIAAASTEDEDGAKDGDSATGTETAESDSDDYEEDAPAVTVNVRVCVDGKWLYASRNGAVFASADSDGYEPISVTKQAYRAGGYREIVPASVIAESLSAFGFAPAECARADNESADWGNYIFAYAPAGTSAAYADVTPQVVDGTWYVFTMNAAYLSSAYSSSTLDLYYLPANRNDGAIARPSSFYGDGSKSASDAQLMADNCFHPVNVSDDDGLVYPAGAAPATTYVCEAAGKNTVTVETPGKNVYWDVAGATATIADNGDGTTSISLSNITGAVSISAKERDMSKVSLTYSAEMADSDRITVGGIPIADQVFEKNASIDGAASKTVEISAADGAAVKLAAPDEDSVTLTWKRASSGKTIYTFAGWDIGGTVHAAGEEISYEELSAAADAAGRVTAKSTWTPKDNGATKHINTANFYLNLNCEILDVSGSSQSQSSAYYTASIFATRVWGTDTFGADSAFTLLAPASSTSAAEVDEKIRGAARGKGIFPPESWTNYTDPDGVRLEALPSDEEVLESVRDGSYAIKIDGEAIDKSTLTADNFTVRWAAVKYDATDGWHIDGVLVAKKAKLTISKTFEGEGDALAAFAAEHGYPSLADFDEAEDFHIDVTHDEDGSAVTDYELLLVADSDMEHDDSTDRRYGYTTHDPSTNTYTWEIDTRQYREYTIAEKNYFMDADSWNNLTWYQVRNSTNGSDTAGWKEYDAATAVTVKVLAAAYPADSPISSVQAVAFRNAYVHKGTLIVHKNDHATGQPMPGVAFAVSQTDAAGTGALYRKAGTSEYTTDPSVYEAGGDYEKVEDARAVTDEQGVFYLSLAAPDASSDVTATYVLSEDKATAPGYEGPDTVTFSMTYKGGIADGKVETTGASADVEWARAGENRFALYISNRSTEYTSVTAKAQWAAGSEAKTVTVQLWRRYGSVDEPVTPSAGESSLVDVAGNEIENTAEPSSANSWAVSWGGLPLFINNEQVTYHLKETWIGSAGVTGSVAYDASADSDGYADYVVAHEAARYARGDMPDTSAEGDALRASYPLPSPVNAGEDGSVSYANHALLVVDNAEAGLGVSITKVDADSGAALAGAVFALYADEACTDEIERATTGADGLAAFSGHGAGTYYLREVAAPAGYAIDRSATWKAVAGTGRPTVTLVGDSDGMPVSVIKNELGASLTVVKVGAAEGTRLAGAVFSLAREGEEARELATGADGTLTFTGLKTGRYMLVETKAPKGYMEPDGAELSFTASVDAESGEASIAPDDAGAIGGGTFVSWADVSADGNVAYELTVRNTPDGALPPAGSAGLALLAGAACIAGACGLRARRKGGGELTRPRASR